MYRASIGRSFSLKNFVRRFNILRPCSALNALPGNAVQVLFVHFCWCFSKEQHESNSNKDIVHVLYLLTNQFFALLANSYDLDGGKCST
jgi:hypothetical protein